MIDPRTLATLGNLDGASSVVYQGIFRKNLRNTGLIDPRTLATYGFLDGSSSVSYNGFFRRRFGRMWNNPLSVSIQGTLFGARHTALQGFTKYIVRPPRKRVAATMPKFMQTRTRFRF